MDEPEFETEYQRVTRELDELKYKRNFGPGVPASQQPGTDLAPIYFIGFAVVAFLVLVYLGSRAG